MQPSRTQAQAAQRGLHSLRHYSATELIAAGVDIRTVAGRLGHGSGGAATLKIYAAWVDGRPARGGNNGWDRRTPPRRRWETVQVIAASLRKQIHRLAPAIWSRQLDLAVAHNVSIATAHRAIALLTNEGLILTWPPGDRPG
jgi:hypothetical protein